MNELDDINFPADFDDLSKYAPLLEKLRAKGDGFAVPENYFETAKEIAAAKTVLPSADGFSVPENYFEELAGRIISLVNLSLIENKTQAGNNSFSVPENYFEDFAENVSTLAALSALKNTEAFEVPDAYFKELDESLNTKIALDNLRQDEGFLVPENYFEKLSEKVLSRVAVDELHDGSEADVPPGYFDTLATRIAARIAEEEGVDETKTLQRGRVIVFAEVLKRYARPLSLAASVALVIGVSLWFYTGGKPAKNEMAYQAKSYFAPAHSDTGNFIFPAHKEEEVAAVKKEKQKIRPALNHPEEQVVKQKIEKKDVLDQLDLLDEGTVVDYASSQDTKLNSETNDPALNQSMIDYLNSQSDELPTRDIHKLP